LNLLPSESHGYLIAVDLKKATLFTMHLVLLQMGSSREDFWNLVTFWYSSFGLGHLPGAPH
jgi:hypothetical protein